MSRIVQIAGFYAPTSGGLRTAVDALAGQYRSAGHEPALVVPGSGAATSVVDGCDRVCIRSPRLPGTPYRVLVDGAAVGAALDRLGPEVVEVHDKLVAPAVLRWAATHRVRALVVSHERLDGILAGRVPRWFPLRAATDAWNRRLARAGAPWVAASAYAAEEARRVGAQVVQVPWGVDLDRFAPGSPSSPPVVAVVGRLSAEKRPDLAIDGFRQLIGSGARAHLAVVGDGPQRRRLERRAAGLPVTFTGHVPAAEVAGWLARASVLIAPCPVETFGLAVLEALASGTPVVVADRGGARELLAPGTGLAVPSRPGAIADGVAVLLSRDPNESAAAARRHAESFTWRRAAATLLCLHGLEPAVRSC